VNISGTRPRLGLGLERFSALYLWALFIIVFGIWTPGEFLTSATLHSVATGQAISAMIAVAVLIPLACGEFDLSVGANANFTGIVAILVQVNLHWNVVLSVLFSVLLGVLIGAINGLIVVRLRVSSFIATLGMGSILAALLVIVTGSAQPAPVTSSAWNDFTQFSVGGTQIVVVYMLVLGVLAWWFLQHTPAGRYIFAVGGNREAARLSGVRVNWWSFSTLVISGGIAGLSGVLYTSLTGPSLTFGNSLLLPAFAAAFLGSTQLLPGRFNVWGTLIAIYVLATGVQGLELVSGQQWLSDMFNGVALILAVALAVGRQHRISRGSGKRAARERQDEPDVMAAAQQATDTQSEPLSLGSQPTGE
jgi:ribose transport system permease protein